MNQLHKISMKYKQGDPVVIHSLDDSGDTYQGKICGISVDWGEESGATIWIVECPEFGAQIGFTHVTIPQSCLRPL